jgi:hypothetical protein
MTQIGTMAFNAETSPCQSTVVSLTNTVTNNIFDSVAKVIDGDIGGAAETWTDGYEMRITMTMGQQALANSVSQTCFTLVSMKANDRAAMCFQAKAGDEDGRLLAGGVSARWIAAESFNTEGIEQAIDNQGTIGKTEGFRSSPASAWRGQKLGDGTYDEPKDVISALNKGAMVSATWYQPSMSNRYVNVPRYNAGDIVQAYASGLGSDEESWNKFSPCMKATLTGASNLIAGAAIAFGAASLF